MRKLSASMILVFFFEISVAMAAGSWGLDKQTPETLESLESRAASGNEKAQMKLATMYLKGKGVNADISKALFYYRLVAERDIPFAQHKLAQLYLDGNHVKPNPAKALNWLLRSARLGFVRAQLDLSLLYESGAGITQDFVKAHKWLSIASSLTEMNLEPRKEELELKMTFSERVHAEVLSRICILTGYESC